MNASASRSKGRYSAILLTMLLALSVIPLGVMPAGADGTGGRAYSTHTAILITDNSGFTTANGVTGGTGVVSDPYKINGWEISASTTPGIAITGTTVHFLITGCRIKDIGTGQNGIALQNVENGQIISNEFAGTTGNGITLQNTGSSKVEQNTVAVQMTAIILQNANSNSVKGNTVTSGAMGLAVQNSDLNTITQNKLSGTASVMAIQNANNNTVTKNEFGSGTGGVELQNAYDNTLTENNFHDLTQPGVTTDTTANNKFHHNNFKNTGGSGKQAVSDGSADQWDDGSKGNYWSDWTTPDANQDGVVDTPYTLGGGFETDRYPLTTEVGGTVAPPIAVTILADKTAGDYPLAVNFTSSASGGTPPFGYAWSFGDGGTATTATASHTFSTAGNFTVTLKVTDTKSVSKTSDAIVIKVTKPILPIQVSISTDKLTGKAPLALKFTSSVSGGVPPYTYAWTFDDGDISTEANPNHTYKKSGTFTVKLKVTDKAGKDKLVDKIIIVLPKEVPKPGFIPGFEAMVLVIAVVLGMLLVRRKQ